jgi:hypothetical protein
MAAQDGVKRVPKIARNRCPNLAKYARLRGWLLLSLQTIRQQLSMTSAIGGRAAVCFF